MEMGWRKNTANLKGKALEERPLSVVTTSIHTDVTQQSCCHLDVQGGCTQSLFLEGAL